MSIHIISLPVSRWQECRELRLKALKTDPQAFCGKYEDEFKLPDQRWIDWLQDAQDGKSYLLFAEHNATLVGMVGALINQEQHEAIIISMYVDPECRGKKIGTLLVQELLEKLKMDDRVQHYLLNVNASLSNSISFYEGMGFKKTRQEPMLNKADEQVQVWVMEREKI